MKSRYKISIIAFSALLGTLFIQMAASNMYCDHIADSCTLRITRVGPGDAYLPAERDTREDYHAVNENVTAVSSVWHYPD